MLHQFNVRIKNQYWCTAQTQQGRKKERGQNPENNKPDGEPTVDSERLINVIEYTVEP